ncbi:MAG: metallophosphoesterase, partial [Crocinitomicaceae bacterium]|nr:metallophosphoesterase [Crocinitomicaceae bacterium]
MRIRIGFILFVTGFFNLQFIIAQTSPFNNKTLQIDSTGNYSFIVSGHFYGDGTNKSGYPANTLLANLDWINSSGADMLICLGDLFMDIRNDMPKYKTSLFDKLNIPLFNAVGNHDISADVYQKNYGATYFSFKTGNDFHLILDTELDNGDIKEEQLMLLEEIALESEKGNIANVFVYAHRTIWKDSYSEMEGLFEDNTQSLTSTNFESEVLPLAKRIGSKANLYWFAGSLGDAPASFFYYEDKKNKITYIATAIRALLRDAVLLVNVENDIVSFKTHSFTNQKLENLDYYNLDFWKSTSAAEPFNYKLIPLYIKNIVFSRIFWYGIGFALSIVGVFRLIQKR